MGLPTGDSKVLEPLLATGNGKPATIALEPFVDRVLARLSTCWFGIPNPQKSARLRTRLSRVDVLRQETTPSISPTTRWRRRGTSSPHPARVISSSAQGSVRPAAPECGDAVGQGERSRRVSSATCRRTLECDSGRRRRAEIQTCSRARLSDSSRDSFRPSMATFSRRCTSGSEKRLCGGSSRTEIRRDAGRSVCTRARVHQAGAKTLNAETACAGHRVPDCHPTTQAEHRNHRSARARCRADRVCDCRKQQLRRRVTGRNARIRGKSDKTVTSHARLPGLCHGDGCVTGHDQRCARTDDPDAD